MKKNQLSLVKWHEAKGYGGYEKKIKKGLMKKKGMAKLLNNVLKLWVRQQKQMSLKKLK